MIFNATQSQKTPQSSFTTGETELDYFHQKLSVGVHSRATEGLTTQDLRKLRNWQKIPEMLGFDSDCQAVDPKANFDAFC